MINLRKILSFTIGSFLGVAALQASMPNTGQSKNILELGYSSFASSNAPLESSLPDDADNKFVLYINQNTLNIKYNKPLELVNGEVIIFNLLGQEITRKKLENNTLNQISIPVQNTCYIVRINYSGKIHTQKVVASNQ
jgi:hypothetical protein